MALNVLANQIRDATSNLAELCAEAFADAQAQIYMVYTDLGFSARRVGQKAGILLAAVQANLFDIVSDNGIVQLAINPAPDQSTNVNVGLLGDLDIYDLNGVNPSEMLIGPSSQHIEQTVNGAFVGDTFQLDSTSLTPSPGFDTEETLIDTVHGNFATLQANPTQAKAGIGAGTAAITSTALQASNAAQTLMTDGTFKIAAIVAGLVQAQIFHGTDALLQIVTINNGGGSFTTQVVLLDPVNPSHVTIIQETFVSTPALKLTASPAHAVVIGQGAGNVTYASPGAAGQILKSNGPGVDPSFQ